MSFRQLSRGQITTTGRCCNIVGVGVSRRVTRASDVPRLGRPRAPPAVGGLQDLNARNPAHQPPDGCRVHFTGAQRSVHSYPTRWSALPARASGELLQQREHETSGRREGCANDMPRQLADMQSLLPRNLAALVAVDAAKAPPLRRVTGPCVAGGQGATNLARSMAASAMRFAARERDDLNGLKHRFSHV